MSVSVAIIDYGSGNLRSAAKAFERSIDEAGIDGDVRVTAEPADLATASHIVLPGVGAFADCHAGVLALPGMIEALEIVVHKQNKPFLGICVGMQLMADRGLEHGTTPGFAWIGGDVRPIKPSDKTLKIPHMGWNQLTFDASDHPVTRGLEDGAHAYFVHSYAFTCADPKNRLASVDYGGPLTAMIAQDNMVGTQFHPEKSQATGLKLIRNFLLWRP